MRIRATLLTALTTLAPIAAQDIGSEAADIQWRTTFQFEGMPTKQLSELRGSVVMLEFWGTWCGPCIRQIPHLNELHEKFKEKGLVVLGANSEKDEDVTAFIKEREVKYPMATAAFPPSYDHRGIPHCYLIDIEGKIAWRGHPAELKESKLHELLVKAKPAYVLPGLEEVHRMRVGEQFGAAYVLGRQLLEKGELSEAATLQVKGWMSKAEWFVDKSLTEADAAEKQEDVYQLWAKLDPVVRLYAGVPGSADAKTRLDALTEIKKNQLEIEAGQKFAEATRLEGEKDYTAAMEIYKELSKRHRRTRAGKDAKVRYREMLEAGMLGYDVRCPYCKAGGSACASHARKR